MRDLYSHSDHARVGYFRTILEAAGIPTILKNDASFNVTEFSSLVVAPTIAVTNDEDYARARQLLLSAVQPPPEFRADWACPHCQAEVPGNFETCWQCGTDHESGAPFTSPPPEPGT